MDGPLANVRGERPETVAFAGTAQPLREVWIAVRANLRVVLESVTLAEVAEGRLPEIVTELTGSSEAWRPH